ncbi:A disintegrin and metalloproteinase with thrombospondin motifs 3-like [Watersipora subatra]|uniref:A disintegrin and metalloproteinase with thrombospondin motifs 3-like n=1 Tax=Watersipora subatra TaxID=2589382 RepID=UPI00355B2058
MYLSRGRMSPAGYAPVTGMCRPDRSCALIKEDGFSTSFVAAHEIGHTIGMSHDGEGTNKCVNEPKRGSIMAPLVMANLNNYFWSPCSKEEIDSILSTLYCMRDNPFTVTWSDLEMPLGKNWDLDDQCEKEFGKGFQLCSRTTHNFNPCENLWCSTPGNRYLCKTKRAPPLPGSTCARDRWCFNSQCIVANPDDPIWKDKKVEHSRLKSVDGSWSRWASWSGCSTTCGRGIKSRTRTCDNPEPALGGRDCVGESYDLRLCDLPEQMRMVCKMFSTLSYSVRRSCMKHKVYYRTCKREIDDARLDQCSRYNKRGRTYKPFEPDEEAVFCLLNCKTEEQNIPLYGEIEAMDGTFCSYNDRNAMCYAGKCIPVGCDGKINSGAREDMCGQCKGDNSQCTLRQDYYNEKLERGYQLLVRLYPGTRNFKIKKPNDAYKIVLRNVKTNETILPVRQREPFNKTDYGALWSYSNTRSDTLESAGPLQAEYDVMIYSLYSGMRVSLSITFTEPLSVVRENDQLSTTQSSRNQKKGKTKYSWSTDGWGECSQPCGDGMYEQLLVCRNTKTNRTVHELLCKSEEKPNTLKKTCNIKACEVWYRWVVSEWTKCPEELCSLEKALQRRWAFCVRESPELEVRWHRVKDSFCSTIESPLLMRECNRSSCSEPGYWKTDSISLCSVSCGEGVQTREVSCVPINPSSIVIARCDEREKPSTSEICVQEACTSSTSLFVLSTTIQQESTTQIENTYPVSTSTFVTSSRRENGNELLEEAGDVIFSTDLPTSEEAVYRNITVVLPTTVTTISSKYAEEVTPVAKTTSIAFTSADERPAKTVTNTKGTELSSISRVKQATTTTTGIPTETTVISTETTGIPTETTVISTETTDIPTETTVISTETIVIPTETTVIPIEATIIPTETTVISTETTVIPTETMVIPIETTFTPIETTIIPTETTVISTETTVIPTETITPVTDIPIMISKASDSSTDKSVTIEATSTSSTKETKNDASSIREQSNGYNRVETTHSDILTQTQPQTTTRLVTQIDDKTLISTNPHQLVTTTQPNGETTPIVSDATSESYRDDSTSKYVWWWTVVTTSTTSLPTRTQFVWWWTTPTISQTSLTTQQVPTPDASTDSISMATQTTQTNKLTTTNNKSNLQNCDKDESRICPLMDSHRCKLLLFRRLCCNTCAQYL